MLKGSDKSEWNNKLRTWLIKEQWRFKNYCVILAFWKWIFNALFIVSTKIGDITKYSEISQKIGTRLHEKNHSKMISDPWPSYHACHPIMANIISIKMIYIFDPEKSYCFIAHIYFHKNDNLCAPNKAIIGYQ